jgi:tetratricopeptide (TPR) repeat protein
LTEGKFVANKLAPSSDPLSSPDEAVRSALIFECRGEIVDAQDTWEHGAAKWPDNARLLQGRAWFLERWPESARLCVHALSAQDVPDAQLHMGQFPRPLLEKTMQTLIGPIPAVFDNYPILAKRLRSLASPDERIAIWQSLASRLEYPAHALFFLGLEQYQEKQYSAAEDTFARALSGNPASAPARAMLGCAKFRQNNFPEAAKELGEALDAGASWHDFGKMLAEAVARTGNVDNIRDTQALCEQHEVAWPETATDKSPAIPVKPEESK